jgi:hypothetical protein
MLHELLLSLSGHSSSLLDDDALPLTPPERELVRRLGALSKLHAEIRTRIQTHSRRDGHPICNAVFTAIETVNLRQFQQTILKVEEKILKKDTATVGAYNIVPLASVVGEFDDWPRRLEWIRRVVAFILDPSHSTATEKTCSGAALINKLRDDALSGHPYIERNALELSKVAELAWLRQLSNWLLYGQIPPSDFFLSRTEGGEYVVRRERLPKFVEPHTLASIEFIGHSLSQVNHRSRSNSTADINLIPTHQKILSELSLPISGPRLSEAVEAIRLSLSRNVLQKLLPVEDVLRLMGVLREFLLLGQGEFAVSLIRAADDQSSRNRQVVQHVTSKDQTQGMAVKQGELTMILRKTWSYLSPILSDDESIAETLEMARDLLKLVVAGRSKDGSRSLFNDLLLAIPTSLTLTVTTPFDLFISKADVKTYSDITSYLLAIRGGHIHLTDLWKQSQLRRVCPTALGPPQSCTEAGAAVLKLKGERRARRDHHMRKIWATSSAAIFLLSELCNYFEGQVIPELWDQLAKWIEPKVAKPSMSQAHDPASLAAAHRTFLDSLDKALLLSDTTFVNALRELLRSIDEMRGHILRLQTIQCNMDMEEDEGVVNYMTNNQQDSVRCESELDRSRKLVDMWAKQVVRRLKELGDTNAPPLLSVAHNSTAHNFAPIIGAKIEWLLMKLEYSTVQRLDESPEDGQLQS